MAMDAGELTKIGYQKRDFGEDADRDVEQLTGHGHLFVNQCEAQCGDKSGGVPELIGRD